MAGRVAEASANVKKEAMRLRQQLSKDELLALAYRLPDEPPEWVDAYNTAIQLQVAVNKQRTRNDSLRDVLKWLLETTQRDNHLRNQ